MTTTQPLAASAAFKPQDTRNRRTPYTHPHREQYVAGDTAKKASIIRKCLRMGQPIHAQGAPVLDAKSEEGILQVRIPQGWTSDAPIFSYISPGAA